MPADATRPLWADTSPELGPELGPQPGPGPRAALPERVDLAIVGGGFTGLSTALHAAEAGIDALVLEAHEIGHGGSGRNAGLVNAGAWLPPDKVRAALGTADGARFLQRLGEAPQAVFDLIERHEIACEATRAGTIHAAHAPSGLRDLRARHAQWQALGAPVRLLDATEMAEKTGSRAFHGGLFDARAGTINPMGYVRGLARAATRAGAAIRTGARVLRLARDGEDWRLQLADGSVTARTVLLATNAYADGLLPELPKAFTTIHYLQLATAPLGNRGAEILPERQGLWDTAPIMTSVRRDAAGRLIVGSMGRVIGGAGAGISRRWAEKRLARLFPDLGPCDFEQAWDGQIAMTAQHLPRLHNPAPGLYAATAYNGRGVTTGTVLGQALAGFFAGQPAQTLPLPITVIPKEPGHRLKRRIFDLAFTAHQIATPGRKIL